MSDWLKLVATKYRPAVEVTLLVLAILWAGWQFIGQDVAAQRIATVSLEASAPKHARQDAEIADIKKRQEAQDDVAAAVRATRADTACILARLEKRPCK